MEFAEILKSLIPGATRATIEIEGATITIEPKTEPKTEPEGQEEAKVHNVEAKPQIEGVSMDDILVPTKPLKEPKKRVHREAATLKRDREKVFSLVQGSGRSGMTSRDLVGSGVSIGTVHSDLRWLVMQGRIMRSGESYYTV